MKKVFSYMLISLLATLFLVSCKDDENNDNNNNNNGPLTGILHVYVKKDTPNGPYIGNAEVYLYKTKADRTADNYHSYSLTGSVNPTNEPAVFDDLEFNADEGGKYYLKAERQISSKMYIGLSEVLVPVQNTTGHHMAMIEQ